MSSEDWSRSAGADVALAGAGPDQLLPWIETAWENNSAVFGLLHGATAQLLLLHAT